MRSKLAIFSWFNIFLLSISFIQIVLCLVHFNIVLFPLLLLLPALSFWQGLISTSLSLHLYCTEDNIPGCVGSMLGNRVTSVCIAQPRQRSICIYHWRRSQPLLICQDVLLPAQGFCKNSSNWTWHQPHKVTWRFISLLRMRPDCLVSHYWSTGSLHLPFT